MLYVYQPKVSLTKHKLSPLNFILYHTWMYCELPQIMIDTSKNVINANDFDVKNPSGEWLFWSGSFCTTQKPCSAILGRNWLWRIREPWNKYFTTERSWWRESHSLWTLIVFLRCTRGHSVWILTPLELRGASSPWNVSLSSSFPPPLNLNDTKSTGIFLLKVVKIDDFFDDWKSCQPLLHPPSQNKIDAGAATLQSE